MSPYSDPDRPTTRTPRPEDNPVESLPPRSQPTQAMRWDDGFSGEAPSNATRIMRTGPPSFAWLVILNGPWAGHLFRLDPKGTVIGRDGRSDIILDEDAVSNLHAKVRAEGEEDGRPLFFIQDLASSNGTFVNGAEIVKSLLQDGDRVLVGQTTLAFKQV